MAYFLALGSFVLGGCHLLPRSPPGRSLIVCLFLVIGFIGTQGMLSATIAALGLVPRGPLHDLVEYLTDYDGDRPVVLLVGSSFTQQGVDPDVLADTLGSSGRSVAVLPLAIGGLSHLERLYYLKDYLAHAKRMPQLVLFEIAGGYYNWPLVQLPQMLVFHRLGAVIGGGNTRGAFRWLFTKGASPLTNRIVLARPNLAPFVP